MTTVLRRRGTPQKEKSASFRLATPNGYLLPVDAEQRRSSDPLLAISGANSPHQPNHRVATDKNFIAPTNLFCKKRSLISFSGEGRKKLVILIGMVVTLLPWIYHSSLNWRKGSLIDTIDHHKRKQSELDSKIKRGSQALKKIREDSRALEHENTFLLRTLRLNGNGVGRNVTTYIQAEDTEERFFSRIHDIESVLREKSKRSLEMKFGESPYRIEFTLAREPAQGSGKLFVLETAKIAYLPHSIEFFMRMTEDKFWDGLSLSRSADGSRIQTVERQPSRKLSGDEEVLSKLAFSEYSQSLTIEKYSGTFHSLLAIRIFFHQMKSSSVLLRSQLFSLVDRWGLTFTLT